MSNMSVPENLAYVLDALLLSDYPNVDDTNCMRVFINDSGTCWIDALFDVGSFCVEVRPKTLVGFLTLINKLHSDPKKASKLFFELNIPCFRQWPTKKP